MHRSEYHGEEALGRRGSIGRSGEEELDCARGDCEPMRGEGESSGEDGTDRKSVV